MTPRDSGEIWSIINFKIYYPNHLKWFSLAVPRLKTKLPKVRTAFSISPLKRGKREWQAKPNHSASETAVQQERHAVKVWEWTDGRNYIPVRTHRLSPPPHSNNAWISDLNSCIARTHHLSHLHGSWERSQFGQLPETRRISHEKTRPSSNQATIFLDDKSRL